MVEKGIRVKCCRCGHEEFRAVDFEEEDVSMNEFVDHLVGWWVLRWPWMVTLCDTCYSNFKEKRDEFMNNCQ